MNTHAYNFPAMTSPPDPFSLSAIADRLRITRKALGLTQPLMSTLAGLTDAQGWSNYENRWRRISIDVAQNLHTRLGITLHWIYRGEMEGLPKDLADKIALQLRSESRKARR